MKLCTLYVLLLVFEIVKNVNLVIGQINDCYSIDNRTQSVELICKNVNGTVSKNDCIHKLFDKNGIFASDTRRNEVKKLKIIECTNSDDYALFAKFENINVFDISHVGLSSLVPSQYKYQDLDVFNASYNELSTIPDEFCENMPYIKIVDFSHNNLNSIYGHTFRGCNKISTLVMSHNKFSGFSITGAPNLQEVDISFNQIQSIYDIFTILYVKMLNIKNNPLKINCDTVWYLSTQNKIQYSFDNVEVINSTCWLEYHSRLIVVAIEDGIILQMFGYEEKIRFSKKWFKQLRTLIIECNTRSNAKAIIDSLGSSIEHLQLTGCYIGQIDEVKFRKFSHLKTLRLSNANLDTFTLSCISNIMNLEVLDVSNNNLMEIGDATLLSEAINLKKLYVQENQIKNIRELIGYLGPSTEELDLSHSITGEATEQTFEKMIHLRVLNLQETNLINFDFGIIEHLNQLETLDISKNKLITISSLSTLSNFHNLIMLKVNDNKLKNCGDLLQHLPVSLRELDISGNSIGEINPNMSLTSTRLSFLKMSHSNLSSFNFHSIESFTKLERLDISANNLKKVNFTSSFRFYHLNEINLQMNELTELDTLSPENFRRLKVLVSKNRFTCEYLNRLEFKWEDDGGCLEEIKFSTMSIQNTDHGFVEKLVFKKLKTVNPGQIGYCYSIDKCTQALDFFCKSVNGTESKNDCIHKLFNENGVFAICTRNKVKKLKIIGCTNADDYLLLAKVENITIFDISHVGLSLLVSPQSEYLFELNVFNASYNELSTIPVGLFDKMPNIRVVDFSYNNLNDTNQYDLMQNLKLRILNISHNKISEFNTKLPPDLQELDISYNQIELIRFNVFEKINSLKVLNIRNNPLKFNCNFLWISLISFEIHYSFDNIEAIDLKCWGTYEYRELANNIKDNTSLNSIGRKGTTHWNNKLLNQFRMFIIEYNTRSNAKAIIDLSKLSIEHLKLNGNYIGQIDAVQFQKPKYLRTLRLSNANLDYFSLSYMNNITNLEVLDVSKNNLIEIDGAIFSEAINLKKLYVQDNQITNIKEIIGNLGPLTDELDLSHNIIGEATKQMFKKMIHLRVLNLQQTNLINFDFGIIEHLNQLETLDISKNKLKKINSLSTLSNFHNLIKLKVNDNQLKNCGDLLQHLPASLRELDISGNDIGEINRKMSLTLSELTFLSLSHSNLSSFNFHSIESFTKLEKLDISANNLKKVNFTSSFRFYHLNEINLQMNELTELDTLSPENFRGLNFRVLVSKNRFTCEYLNRLEFEWEDDGGCLNGIESSTMTIQNTDYGFAAELSIEEKLEITSQIETEKNEKIIGVSEIPTGDDKTSIDVLYVCVSVIIVTVIIVAAVLVTVVLRKRQQTTVTDTQTERAIELNTMDENEVEEEEEEEEEEEARVHHIYEEIPEPPVACDQAYDHLEFNVGPMPLSQHTRTHYDNARVLSQRH